MGKSDQEVKGGRRPILVETSSRAIFSSGAALMNWK
jgi:hypothetical protein